MKSRSTGAAILLFVVFAFTSNCFASPIPIMGTARSDEDSDQNLSLLLFQPVNSGRFMNFGDGPSTPIACVAGNSCHFTQTISVFFYPLYFSGGADYRYDIAFANLFFDMTTTDLISEADLATDWTSVSVFSTGTVTGTLGFYDCATPGVDCLNPAWRAFRNGCTDGIDCPVIPIQSCGDKGDANCTFAISGLAQGYTNVVGPRPRRNLEFMGAANLVPEPSGYLLFGTGLLGVVGIVRRKFLG